MEIKPKSFLYYLILWPGTALLRSFDWLVGVCTADKDVLNPEDIPYNDKIESKLNEIYAEFYSVYAQGHLPDIKDFYKVQTDIGQDEHWKAFPFIVYNHTFRENMDRCPETARLIRELPGCTSAMYSLLHPGKHILPHTGVYKGVLRCLFTLKASDQGNCWIRVNDKKMIFETGKCIYFDETFEHEVKNDSEEIRVVLYLDLYRKLPFPLNLYNKLIFNLLRRSPYIQTIIREYNKIDKNDIQEHHPVPALNYR